MPTTRSITRLAGTLALAAFVTGATTRDPQPAQDSGVTVTFLANEGVMLSAGSTKVMIDALFVKYGESYAIAADSTQLALRLAQPPFDSVSLVLATHHHGDHFHPGPVAAHLRSNPRAVVLASQQVIDSLKGRVAPGAIGTRVLAREVARGSMTREVVNGVPVTMLGLAHHDLKHFGYIVEIGGRRVLHVGDTDDGAKSFPAFRLDTMRIDVALLPSWMGRRARDREMIERLIKPRHVAFFHLSDEARFRDQVEREVRAVMPQAVVFSRSLESRRW
jgi:L-ascorbate metabolism protein UlaG (beta-lactamase superfamily)